MPDRTERFPVDALDENRNGHLTRGWTHPLVTATLAEDGTATVTTLGGSRGILVD